MNKIFSELRSLRNSLKDFIENSPEISNEVIPEVNGKRLPFVTILGDLLDSWEYFKEEMGEYESLDFGRKLREVEKVLSASNNYVSRFFLEIEYFSRRNGSEVENISIGTMVVSASVGLIVTLWIWIIFWYSKEWSSESKDYQK